MPSSFKSESEINADLQRQQRLPILRVNFMNLCTDLASKLSQQNGMAVSA